MLSGQNGYLANDLSQSKFILYGLSAMIGWAEIGRSSYEIGRLFKRVVICLNVSFDRFCMNAPEWWEIDYCVFLLALRRCEQNV